MVSGNARVFSALASQQSQLADLVTTFNATMAALAARQQDLEPDDRAAAAACCAPPTTPSGRWTRRSGRRSSSRAISPRASSSSTPRSTPGLPWIAQSHELFSRQELGGLLATLTPAVQGTGEHAQRHRERCCSGSDELAHCFIHNLIPTGNEVIQDPPVTTGLQVYQELFQRAVGLAGAAQNFDGNGRYVRAAGGRRL